MFFTIAACSWGAAWLLLECIAYSVYVGFITRYLEFLRPLEGDRVSFDVKDTVY